MTVHHQRNTRWSLYATQLGRKMCLLLVREGMGGEGGGKLDRIKTFHAKEDQATLSSLELLSTSFFIYFRNFPNLNNGLHVCLYDYNQISWVFIEMISFILNPLSLILDSCCSIKCLGHQSLRQRSWLSRLSGNLKRGSKGKALVRGEGG